MTVEIRSGETSTPYSSCKCAWMSRTLIPRAYIDNILSSKPSKRVCPFLMSRGSNQAARSRGTSISTCPRLPLIVFGDEPLRELPELLPKGACLS